MTRWLLGQYTKGEARAILVVAMLVWALLSPSGLGGELLAPGVEVTLVLLLAFLARLVLAHLLSRIAPADRRPQGVVLAAAGERWGLALLVFGVVLSKGPLHPVLAALVLAGAAMVWVVDLFMRVLVGGWGYVRFLSAAMTVIVGQIAITGGSATILLRKVDARSGIGSALVVDESKAGPYVVVAADVATPEERAHLHSLAQSYHGQLIWCATDDLMATVQPFAATPLTLAVAAPAWRLDAEFIASLLDACRGDVRGAPYVARIGFLPLGLAGVEKRVMANKPRGRPARATLLFQSRGASPLLEAETVELANWLRADGVETRRLLNHGSRLASGRGREAFLGVDLLLLVGQGNGRLSAGLGSEYLDGIDMRGAVVVDATSYGADLSGEDHVARALWDGGVASLFGMTRPGTLVHVGEILPALYTGGLSSGECWRRGANLLLEAAEHGGNGPITRNSLRQLGRSLVLIGDPGHVPFPMDEGELRAVFPPVFHHP